jgi:hypothetical protein
MGRSLELYSVTGQTTVTPFGPLVQLKLVVKETGKLTGRFVVRMDLQPEAARELAATLTKLAEVAEKSGAEEGMRAWAGLGRYRTGNFCELVTNSSTPATRKDSALKVDFHL